MISNTDIHPTGPSGYSPTEGLPIKTRSLSSDKISRIYFWEGSKNVEIKLQSNTDDEEILSMSPTQTGFLSNFKAFISPAREK